MKLYGHPRCSTVKKATKFLDEQGINYEYYNLTEVTPSKEEFKLFHEVSGKEIKKFFNTSGNLYKELKLKDKLSSMSLEECYDLLSKNGMLVKRPLLIKDDIILNGFKVDEYLKLK